MNELIRIEFKDDGAVVSARDLHRGLEVKTRFSQWVLYAKYLGKGYVSSRTFDYVGKDGKTHSNVSTVWTQLGRRFLYDKLKAIDILPIIEQED